MALKVQDSLLNRVTSHKSVNEDRVLLSDPIGTVSRLVLDGGVPPRIYNEDMIRRGEGEPYSTGLEREKHDFRTISRLKTLNERPSVRRRAINSAE
jgi:hypothetical protein